MQNTTTQPPQELNNQYDRPKSVNPVKRVLAVFGIVAFVVVAAMGVLIAQRQVTRPGQDIETVSPTAPDSKPSASTYQPNSCVTTFAVPAPEARCDAKVALTNFTSLGGKSIPAGSQFSVGDEFVFSIVVNQPAQGTAKDISVTDVLPNSLVFVSPAPTSTGYTLIRDGQTVTAQIPQMGSASQLKVEFKVRVTSSNYGNQTNEARVANGTGSTAGRPSVCSYVFTTLEGAVSCLDKTMYDLSGKLIPAGTALTRGKEYEYRVRVQAKNRSNGDVKIHDILPKELTYVRPAAGSEKYIVSDPTSGLLIANFGVLENTTMTLGFIMKVPADPELGTVTNTALVYAFPPGSRQKEPTSDADSCSIEHTILPIGTAECVAKEAYTNFSGTKIAPNTELTPGQEFVYKVMVTAEQTTTGVVSLVDKLHQDLTFIQDSGNTAGIKYNASTREVTADLGIMQGGTTQTVQFKVQLAAKPTSTTFTNEAIISTAGGSDDSEHSCEIPLKVKQPTYSCNSECTTTENCTGINKDYICYATIDGNYCRLGSNPMDKSCQPPSTGTPTPTPTGSPTPTPTVTPTPTPTGTPVPTPTPTPVIGCNENCTANADCSNSNHICVTTSDGTNKCRLADYPGSSTCRVPSTATPTPIALQPELPQELPQSGNENWLTFFKAGLATLGIATALFLLL